MKAISILYFIILLSLCCITIISNSGCAQIGAITGGTKDTIPPILLSASPQLLSTNFSGNKITLTFDEYIDVQEVQTNLLVSPYPKLNPEITNKLKTVSVKLKDTLLANTTYAINFGSAIKDVNEGNIFKNFTYVFSTGSTIDSLRLSGKVMLAETGKTDSTIIVLLYRNANDSSVEKIKPNYIANVNGDGSFTFNNLSSGSFNIYALKDGDGGKTYNSKTELFAFTDTTVIIKENSKPITLYAYSEEKNTKTPVTTSKPKTAAQKKLKFTSAAATQKQDLRNDLVLNFNSAIKKFDTTGIILTDTNFVPIPAFSFLLDSNKIILKTKWSEDADYRLIVNKNAVADSTDSILAKTDTLRFKTKREGDYGNVVLRFSNIEFTNHPVLQFTQQDEVKESFSITSKEWRYKLFPPGEYEIKILYDNNNNSKWDPGNYLKKIQPEKVIALPKKISIRENWDNESEEEKIIA